MEGFFYVLFFVTLSFSLLSVEEIQKRIEKAYEKEAEHVESERMIFVNSIIDVLEDGIIKGKVFKTFSSKDTEKAYDGRFGDIRPEDFCGWWNQRFNHSTCSNHITSTDELILIYFIRFEQKK